MNTSLLRTDAFVLKRRSLKDMDEQIILFTEEYGKLATIAKGTRKITSRRLPHIQTGNFLHVLVTKRSEVHYLTHTDLYSGLQAIKAVPEKINYLYQFIFLLDRLLPDMQQETQTYGIFRSFLSQMGNDLFFSQNNFLEYVSLLLTSLGYGDITQSQQDIDMIQYAEQLMAEKMPSHVII